MHLPDLPRAGQRPPTQDEVAFERLRHNPVATALKRPEGWMSKDDEIEWRLERQEFPSSVRPVGWMAEDDYMAWLDSMEKSYQDQLERGGFWDAESINYYAKHHTRCLCPGCNKTICFGQCCEPYPFRDVVWK